MAHVLTPLPHPDSLPPLLSFVGATIIKNILYVKIIQETLRMVTTFLLRKAWCPDVLLVKVLILLINRSIDWSIYCSVPIFSTHDLLFRVSGLNTSNPKPKQASEPFLDQHFLLCTLLCMLISRSIHRLIDWSTCVSMWFLLSRTYELIFQGGKCTQYEGIQY